MGVTGAGGRRQSLARLDAFGSRLVHDALERLPDRCSMSRAVRDGAGTLVDMRLLWMNAAARGAQPEPEAAIGRLWTELCPTILANGSFDACLRVLATGTPETGRCDWTDDVIATPMSCEWTATRLDDDVLLWVARDVGERAGAALANEAHLRTLLDTAPDVILTMDERGIVLSANSACARLLGWAPQELVGRDVNVLMVGRDASEHGSKLKRYRETGEKHIIGRGRDVRARRRDGSTIPARLSIGEAFVGRQRVFVGILHDLTDREALEAQLRQAQKMEVTGRLVSSVAHDFNNMLTVIDANAALLAEASAEPAVHELGLEIAAAVEQAGALTKQLLSFARKALSEATLVRPGELVAGLLPLARRLAGAKVDVVVEDSLAPHVRIVCDAGVIEQGLLNLVANARDAMPDGGTVTIAIARASDDRVRLAVVDDGEGMPPDVLARAGEPFFTTKPLGRGTGLGLTTTIAHVRASGGDVTLASAPGRGTTVALLLPSTEEPAPLATPEPNEARGRETLVLLERDESLRRVLARSLEGLGYTVLEATDRVDAEAHLDDPAQHVHALVKETESSTPLDDATTNALLAKRPDLVVLHTVTTPAAGSGPAFLAKPFRGRELALRLRKLLDAG